MNHQPDKLFAALTAALIAKHTGEAQQHEPENDVDVNDFLDIVAAGNTDPDDLACMARRLLSKRRPPKTEEEYVASMGMNCPSCDSTSIRVTDTYPENSGVLNHVHCADCGAQWKEFYELQGYFGLTR